MKGEGLVGCAFMLVGLVIATLIAALIGEWAIGSALSDIFGAEAFAKWAALSPFIRYSVGAIASEVALPVAIGVWLLTLGLGAPLVG